MVFNATLNNILIVLWWSVLLVEETEENHPRSWQGVLDKTCDKVC
jgi:hypothetical protein